MHRSIRRGKAKTFIFQQSMSALGLTAFCQYLQFLSRDINSLLWYKDWCKPNACSWTSLWPHWTVNHIYYRIYYSNSWIVIRNGVGKSTLLRHIAMREVPIPAHITILFVEQEVRAPFIETQFLIYVLQDYRR